MFHSIGPWRCRFRRCRSQRRSTLGTSRATPDVSRPPLSTFFRVVSATTSIRRVPTTDLEPFERKFVQNFFQRKLATCFPGNGRGRLASWRRTDDKIEVALARIYRRWRRQSVLSSHLLWRLPGSWWCSRWCRRTSSIGTSGWRSCWSRLTKIDINS